MPPLERYNPSLRISSGPIANPEIKTGKLKHAVGGQLVADQYGAFRKLSFAGTYAIHLPVIKEKYNLSFGTRLGIANNAFIQDRAVVKNPTNDPNYTDFVANQSTQNFMNLGAGLYFYSNRLFLGVSGDQLTRGLVSFGASSANFDPEIHANATGGFKFNITNEITLTPAFLVKMMSPAPLNIEGSLQVEYKEWLWAGLSYRHGDAAIVMAGLNITQKFKFGYSYDYSINQFNNYSRGGHELILGIMLR
jgi:type IX secretion system PorP/SprF family membrane protein